MLPVRGSKVKCFLGELLLLFRALAVFRVDVFQMLRVLTVFRGSELSIVPDSQYFRFLWIFPVLRASGASVLRVLLQVCVKYFGVRHCEHCADAHIFIFGGGWSK